MSAIFPCISWAHKVTSQHAGATFLSDTLPSYQKQISNLTARMGTSGPREQKDLPRMTEMVAGLELKPEGGCCTRNGPPPSTTLINPEGLQARKFD